MRSETTAKTEGKTFEAVRTAIDELAALVGYIINNLNGHHVVVTADHGFLFTETARVETDKSKLDEKPENAVLAKKRYLLGPDLPEQRGGLAWQVERDGRGRWRDGVLDSQGGEPLPFRGRRSVRAWRGHAAGDRRARSSRSSISEGSPPRRRKSSR